MVMQRYEPEHHAGEKNVVAIFKVKVTTRAHMIKYYSFYYIFLTVDSLATKLGLMIHHHKPECLVKKNWITAFRVKVTVKGQSVNVCPDGIF